MSTEPGAGAVEDEVARTEHAWAEAIARRDQATCAELLGDEYVFIVSACGFLPWSEWPRTLPTDVVASYAFDELHVQGYGDVAVVRARYRQQATVAGQDRSGAFLLTDVWVRRDGRWQVVTRHSSHVPTART